MTQITKTQVFSQIVDQKEHKNNWYKFGGSTSRFQHHPTRQYSTVHSVQYWLFGLKFISQCVSDTLFLV